MEEDSKNKDTIINLLDKDNQFKDTLYKKVIIENQELKKENRNLNQENGNLILNNHNKNKIIAGTLIIIIIETLIILL